MQATGNLYVIAAPSGTGKTSLVDALVKTCADVVVSISHTTRAKRPNEIEGVHYYFVDKNIFEQMLAKDEFLEHAFIFENLYGTSKTWVEQRLAFGKDVILEIDWQGHQQIKRLIPQAISIFILPPSLQQLEARLNKRKQDSPQVIQTRLADAKLTASHFKEFDYLLINDDFETALKELKIIIAAGRLLRAPQLAKHAKLITELSSIA
jgi:guanylate kinase